MPMAMMQKECEKRDGGGGTTSAALAFLQKLRLPWPAADTEIAVLVLALKGLVLGVAVLSIGTLFDQKETWETLWNRWDATHYLNLAKDGYVAKGPGRFSIVFYPLFPWLIRAAYV